MAWMTACQDNNDDPADPIIPNLQVMPTDTVLFLEPKDTIFFSANASVSWEISGGNITGNGVYTAPEASGIYQVTANPNSSAMTSVIRKVIVTPHATLFKAMQKGDYVLYFRHMTSNTGTDKFGSTASQWWKSCDSTIARQISPQGRVQGQETGSAFKNLSLPVGKIISSEFCRCIQSAEALDLKIPIETSPTITYYAAGEEDRFKKTIALAEAQPITDKITLLIGHSFTTNDPAPALQMGDAAVYKQLPGNKVEFIKIITTADWRAIK